MSCLLKQLTRKIKNDVNRRFDASRIILKIEAAYVNVTVVILELSLKWIAFQALISQLLKLCT